ncbi:FCS-Like Zinc finger 8 isoform X1 [Syzygium oleosum]|uniref:FCS-Like Zinc finger 8 isoform X1 n=1 Tax=Syzygium oleosum TaxID=219896 RepID=UPI0011D18CC0|nr:FCS-Like Zinc finger 8 isoform X1 [Syzygium oleosum]XP_030456681.1 FCS-Like Zinc finger 8 isoform X1 [Syzygium oleosum]
MLRKRSRHTAPTPSTAAARKQALMADYGRLPSPTGKNGGGSPTPAFLTYPKLFTSNFTVKCETESIMSPTSILDTKPFSHSKSSFLSDTSSPKISEPKSIGLAIVDALRDDNCSKLDSHKPENLTVLFGSQLKIQIPKTPTDFGTKTRNSQLGFLSPSLGHSPANKQEAIRPPPGGVVLAGLISASEMELSEDYTCVISHGPNPKTTHIFDDCIVESRWGSIGLSEADCRKDNGLFLADHCRFPSESFLSFCYTCKKNLGDGEDIYIYRLKFWLFQGGESILQWRMQIAANIA